MIPFPSSEKARTAMFMPLTTDGRAVTQPDWMSQPNRIFSQ